MPSAAKQPFSLAAWGPGDGKPQDPDPTGRLAWQLCSSTRTLSLSHRTRNAGGSRASPSPGSSQLGARQAPPFRARQLEALADFNSQKPPASRLAQVGDPPRRRSGSPGAESAAETAPPRPLPPGSAQSPASSLRPSGAMAEVAAETPAGCPSQGAPRPPSCRRLRAVEPVLLLATLALALQAPLSTQLLWDRLAGGNGSRPAAEPAGCPNHTGPGAGSQELETLVAHWNLYLNLAGFFVGLFSVTLFGPWSDSVGRRPVLILPTLGMALQAAIYLVVMYAELPVGYLLVGRVLSGLSGDYNLVLAGCFAYVADVSDQKGRTFRVAVLEACLGLAGMVASVLGGPWRRAQGYVAPFWLVFAASLAAALYAAFALQESVVPRQPRRRLLTLHHYGAVYRLYAGPARGLAWCQRLLYSLAFFVVVTVHFGAREILVLYELGPPLCWRSELIGYGSAANYLTYLSSLAGLRLLQRCLPDAWVAELGLLSNALGLGTMALAGTTALMFTGYGLLFLSMTVTPVIRSKLSRLVGETEQETTMGARPSFPPETLG
ncbi:proton-coupled folate transporter [Pseudonaja textilis]|uniref:proton-coupled folate transporter n=1 Tax=Pseudonaja textilis TaxID=8673 RepID=UPI000EA97C38|nr:proton-coupled folate transporter [Pseudonaja textilis]